MQWPTETGTVDAQYHLDSPWSSSAAVGGKQLPVWLQLPTPNTGFPTRGLSEASKESAEPCTGATETIRQLMPQKQLLTMGEGRVVDDCPSLPACAGTILR